MIQENNLRIQFYHWSTSKPTSECACLSLDSEVEFRKLMVMCDNTKVSVYHRMVQYLHSSKELQKSEDCTICCLNQYWLNDSTFSSIYTIVSQYIECWHMRLLSEVLMHKYLTRLQTLMKMEQLGTCLFYRPLWLLSDNIVMSTVELSFGRVRCILAKDANVLKGMLKPERFSKRVVDYDDNRNLRRRRFIILNDMLNTD